MKLVKRVIFGYLALVGLFTPTALLADPWADAGDDQGRRILIDVASILPPSADGRISVVLMAFPKNWSIQDPSYESWIARYDCNVRDRTITAIHRYSADRGPILETRSLRENYPEVQSQIEIVCDPQSRSGDQQFRSLEEINDWLKRGLRK